MVPLEKAGDTGQRIGFKKITSFDESNEFHFNAAIDFQSENSDQKKILTKKNS